MVTDSFMPRSWHIARSLSRKAKKASRVVMVQSQSICNSLAASNELVSFIWLTRLTIFSASPSCGWPMQSFTMKTTGTTSTVLGKAPSKARVALGCGPSSPGTTSK